MGSEMCIRDSSSATSARIKFSEEAMTKAGGLGRSRGGGAVLLPLPPLLPLLLLLLLLCCCCGPGSAQYLPRLVANGLAMLPQLAPMWAGIGP